MSKKVLILSMGKAGSTAVINALKSEGIKYGRIHWHNRNEVDTSQYDYFIAMAREPVARAISHYFEYGRKEVTSEPEITAYIKKEIAFTLTFFDELVKPITGWGVASLPVMPGMEIANDFVVYTPAIGARGLIIRTEDFNKFLSFGLANLMSIGSEYIAVTHHPKGSERFGPEYDEFRANFRLPHDYLEQVANSRYCQWFGYHDAVMAWSE